MPDKDQVFIFNAAQLQLIKHTFVDNDALLYSIRKVFLQMPLTDVERGLIKMSVTDPVLEVLKIRLLPELSPAYPLGQIPSILTTLTQDIKQRDVEDMALQFEAKQLEINYLTDRFHALEAIAKGEKEGDPIIPLNDLAKIHGKNPVDQYVQMTAYLFLLGYIDPMLLMIRTIAGAKEETPEQQKARMMRDTNK